MILDGRSQAIRASVSRTVWSAKFGQGSFVLSQRIGKFHDRPAILAERSFHDIEAGAAAGRFRSRASRLSSSRACARARSACARVLDSASPRRACASPRPAVRRHCSRHANAGGHRRSAHVHTCCARLHGRRRAARGRLLGRECRGEFAQAGGDVIEARPARGLARGVTDIARVGFRPWARCPREIARSATPRWFRHDRLIHGTGHRAHKADEVPASIRAPPPTAGMVGISQSAKEFRMRRPHGKDDIVGASMDYRAFREHPRVEEAAGLQGRLHTRAGAVRHVGGKIDELPQRRAGRFGADGRISGVGHRRRLVFARLETRVPRTTRSGSRPRACVLR